MELFGIIMLIIVIVLLIAVCILIVCILSDQGCTIAIQKRSTNPELTKKQQEEIEKKRNKFGAKVKRAFNSSSEEDPPAPVQDVKSVEFTFKLADEKKNPEQIAVVEESSMAPLQQLRESPAEREARRKRHEEIRRKYKL